MIEALILYSILMFTLFASCAVMGLIFTAGWIVQRVPWDVLVVAAGVIGYIIWRLN